MTPWPFFPLFVRLQGQPVLLVGGGEVALRKARLLQRAGAVLKVVAPELHPELAAALPQGGWLGPVFTPDQLDGVCLVIAATDDASVNARVAEAAEARGIWVNVVDDPLASRVITPAVVDRSPILVAIGSQGSAPVLVRRLREQLEARLPARLGHLAAFIGARRARVRERLAPERRRDFWERFVDGPGAEALLGGEDAKAAERFEAQLAEPEAPRGVVYLVGAGPGDPDLLTFKALRLMQACDVVLYDRLVPPAILDLVRRDAERVFVGKARNQHSLPQSAINAELLKRAQAGQRVLRLKGGDPFIFGRGGEEIEPLARAGVPFVVVPGITAANGCAAAAGIPLTHRDYAQTCLFVTGHAKADGELSLPWDSLARRGQTVVVYMGLATLATLCERFIAHGLPPDWPCAMVVNGTQPDQRVLTGTLATLPARVAGEELRGAALLIVGEVVRLQSVLGS